MPTFEEVQRAALARGETGAFSESQLAIDQIQTAFQQCPADPFKAQLAPLIGAACAAASACRVLLASAAADFVQQRAVQNSLIQDMRTASKSTVAQSGWGDGATYLAAVASAADKAQQTVESSIQNNILKSIGPRADSAGTKFATTLGALQTGIDAATADYFGPNGLRAGGDTTLLRAQKLANIERHFKGQSSPMLEIGKAFEGYYARGENEKISDLVEAVAPFCAEFLRSAKIPGGTAASLKFVDGEAGIAFRLLSAFKDFQRVNLPESIKTAGVCLADLTIVSSVLVGTTVASMSKSQFEARYLSGAPLPAGTLPPFGPVDSWASRAFSPSAIAAAVEGQVWKGLR